MKTFAVILGVVVGSFAPLAVHADAPPPATKPVVQHNLEVQQRHAKRVHRSEHSDSPARDKSFHKFDGNVKAQPHALDAR